MNELTELHHLLATLEAETKAKNPHQEFMELLFERIHEVETKLRYLMETPND